LAKWVESASWGVAAQHVEQQQHEYKNDRAVDQGRPPAHAGFEAQHPREQQACWHQQSERPDREGVGQQDQQYIALSSSATRRRRAAITRCAPGQPGSQWQSGHDRKQWHQTRTWIETHHFPRRIAESKQCDQGEREGGRLISAGCGLIGVERLQRANALKVLTVLCINLVVVLPLALSGLVNWAMAVGVFVGGLIGGYFGARVTQRIPEKPLRWIAVTLGVVLTVSFLVR